MTGAARQPPFGVDGGTGTGSAVAAHYGRGGLAERILASVASGGQVAVEDLAPIDEFHTGGRRATEALVAQLALRPGSRVLDIGCGIGGTARYLAAVHGCRVVGVDLTPEFVETARVLTEVVGLADRVEFGVADALDLDLPDASFDAACLVHVGMNIADKDGLFAEIARVLRPGGACGVFDIMRLTDGDVEYPTPWAGTPDISFLAHPTGYRQSLDRAGLTVASLRDRSDLVTGAAPARPVTARRTPGRHLLMGEDHVAKTAHVVDAVRDGSIAPVEIIAHRLIGP